MDFIKIKSLILSISVSGVVVAKASEECADGKEWPVEL